MKTRGGRFDLWMLIIGGIFVLPFAHHPLTIDPVLPIRFLLWSALTFCLVLTVTLKNFRGTGHHDFTIVSRRIFFFAACFAASAAVSFPRAVNLPEALFDLQKNLLFFLFLYTASIIIAFNEENAIHALTKGMVVSGTLLALVGIGSLLWPHLFTFHGKSGIQAVMANKNLYSSALFLTTPFALFGAFRLSGAWRIYSLLSLLFVHFAILLTETRAVWLAVFLSAGIIFAAFLCFNRHHEKRRAVPGPSRTIPLLVLLSLATMGPCLVTGKTDVSSVLSTESLKIRFALWDVTMAMIRDRPFSGAGPGQWKIVSPRYGNTPTEHGQAGRKTVICYQRPHNDYLGILSEYGSLGFGFYMLFLGSAVFYGIRILSGAFHDETKIFCLCMLYGVMGYLVISFFSFPRERICHNVFLALILASLVSVYHRACPNRSRHRKIPITWIHGAMLLVLVLFMGTGIMRMRSEVHAKKAVAAIKAGSWDQAVAECNLACSMVYNMDPVSNPIPWYRGMAYFSLGRINEASVDFEKACSIHPWHAYSHNNLGVCYARMGMLKKAEACFKTAGSLSAGSKKDACSNREAVRE
ncbi:MAG: O-antigen ligase family protein [Desulfatiglandales bacterium]